MRLPFRTQPQLLGSRSAALTRLLSMERKLSKNLNLRIAYCGFMSDYERLDHMRKIASESTSASAFLPHHAVIKQDGSGKIRVVFDASQSSLNGHSLNSFLHTGPKLQREMTTVLTRWRLYKFAFTADIVKMFRQILLDPDDRQWLTILWRASPDQPIDAFQLRTVTYGTASAPYQALRVLLQLADDEAGRFPLAAEILRNNFYVDDALAGADTIEEAMEKKKQLRGILATAGMELDKWAANDHALLQDVIATDGRAFNEEDPYPHLGCVGRRIRIPSIIESNAARVREPSLKESCSERSPVYMTLSAGSLQSLSELRYFYKCFGCLARIGIPRWTKNFNISGKNLESNSPSSSVFV